MQGLSLESFIRTRVDADLRFLAKEKKIKQGLLLVLFHLSSSTDYKKLVIQTIPTKKSQDSYKKLLPALIRDPIMNGPYKLGLIQRIRTPNHKSCKIFGEAKECLSLMQRQKIYQHIQHLPINPSLKISQQKSSQLLWEIYPSIQRFVNYKMRFIQQHHNIELEDLVHDLFVQGIINFHWYFPFRDMVYLRHTCLRGIHNYGINLLKHYTCQKRRRLWTDTNGNFYSTIESLDTVSEKYAPLLPHVTNRFWLTQGSTTEQVACQLLLGNEGCKFFTAWANKKLHSKEKCLEEIITKIGYEKYCSLIARYFYQPEKWVNQLRQQLREQKQLSTQINRLIS